MDFPAHLKRLPRALVWLRRPVGLWAAVVTVAVFSFFLLRSAWHQPLPDFAAIEDVEERKAAFFSFLEPFVEEANASLLESRERLRHMRQNLQRGRLNRRDLRWVSNLAIKSSLDLPHDGMPSQELIDELLLRMDVIPPSLALAQAALESAWGTSRFARQGNNLFGIWCYEPGCGIVPLYRPASATYEVARYRSPRDSFLAYMEILNTNPAYRSLWILRENARANGEILTGATLAAGLRLYSQERERYIGKIRNLIQVNQLDRLDQQFWDEVAH